MDLEDGKKGRWSCRPERSSMKSLEKAVADYEKAKEKMEASRARYEADLKRFKAAEAAKTEAENLEIVRIIRGMGYDHTGTECVPGENENGTADTGRIPEGGNKS